MSFRTSDHPAKPFWNLSLLQSVTVAGDAVARDSADAGTHADTDSDSSATRWSRRRVQRFASRAVLALGCLISGMCLILLAACFMDDRAVDSLRGEAVAEVLDTSMTRTVVRFTDAEGRVHIPANGVLYPSGLQEDQMVRVEYDGRNPDLVRVAGRSMTVALLPVLSAVAVVWAVVLPVFLLLRRASRH